MERQNNYVGHSALLAEIEQLYDTGRYLDAWEASKGLGALREWPGPEGRVLAGRLAFSLGATRLGLALHWLSGREHPNDPASQYYAAVGYRLRFGTAHAWLRYRERDLPPGASVTLEASWLAFKAAMLGSMRDFSRAEPLMIEALELDPDNALLHVQLSDLLDAQDLVEDALMAAREALKLRPDFRPAVQTVALRLVQLSKDDEALQLLTNASTKLQSGELWCQLAALQRELKNYAGAWESLDQAQRAWPLAETDKQNAQWLTAQRCDLACLLKQYAQAADLARQVDQPFYQQLSERLSKASASRTVDEPARVHLQVPYVRQFHDTCAPAALTAIAGYWHRPIRQQEIARGTTYDGMRTYDQRRWAEENGFFVREFRVTEKSVDSALKAGMPLIVSTVEPGSAHCQCIVGIDHARGTLLIQDPSNRHLTEAAVDKFLTQYASSGPRCMLMAPADQSQPINELQWDDANLYDEQYTIETALARFDRSAASLAFERMRASAPQHPLSLECALRLAYYDADPNAQIESIDNLLEHFPGDINFLTMKMQWLTQFGTRCQRIELLRAALRANATEPMVCTQLAMQLLDDARDHAEAYRLLRRSLRLSPNDSTSLSVMADYLDLQRDSAQALELHRLAAAAQEKDESQSQRYFMAAIKLNRSEEVLAWLRDRNRRFYDRNSSPARTLVNALDAVNLQAEAEQVLQASIKQHPHDGELLAFAATHCAERHQAKQAHQYLSACEGKCTPWRLQRTRAMLADCEGDWTNARELFRKVIALYPLDYEARDRLVQLELQHAGAAAADQLLCEAIAQLPHSYTLRARRMRFLREQHKFEELDAELSRFVELHPRDAGARMEAAMAAFKNHDLQRAWRESQVAIELAPHHYYAHYVVGRIQEVRGDRAAARAAYRRALELNVDGQWLMTYLVGSCLSVAESHDELAFIYQQLGRQTSFGNGIIEYRSVANGLMSPDALLVKLENFRQLRPDLWQAWSAVVQQQLEMDNSAAAKPLATQATARFPNEYKVWFDLANVHRHAQNRQAELAALEDARSQLPDSPEVAAALTGVYLHEQRLDDAERLLKQTFDVHPIHSARLSELSLRLFEANLLANELVSAERVLSFSGKHLPPGYSCAARLQLLAAQDLRQEPLANTATAFALKWLEEDGSHRVPLGRSLDSLDPRIGLQLLTALKGLLAHHTAKQLPVKPTVSWSLGRLAARLQERNANMDLLKTIPDSDSWHECVRSLMEALPQFGKEYEQLDAIMQKYRTRLKNQTATWSTASWTLNAFDRHNELVAWTRDWRSYPNLQVADLIPVIASRWYLLQIREARKAIEHGLTLPEDKCASALRLWAGLDALLQRQTKLARDHARGIVSHELQGWYKVGYRKLSTCLESLTDDKAVGSSSQSTAARQSIQKLLPSVSEGSPYERLPLTVWLSHELATLVAEANGRRFIAWRHRLVAWAYFLLPNLVSGSSTDKK